MSHMQRQLMHLCKCASTRLISITWINKGICGMQPKKKKGVQQIHGSLMFIQYFQRFTTNLILNKSFSGKMHVATRCIVLGHTCHIKHSKKFPNVYGGHTYNYEHPLLFCRKNLIPTIHEGKGPYIYNLMPIVGVMRRLMSTIQEGEGSHTYYLMPIIGVKYPFPL